MKTKDSGRPARLVDLSEDEQNTWCRAIGRLFICFSPLELLSHRWIGLLFGDAERVKIVRSSSGTLEQRIEKITSRLATLTGYDDVIALWRQVEVEARLRNEIAHSPIGFFTLNGRRFIGLVDVKKLESTSLDPPDLLSPDDIHTVS
ncbi:MAG: hypothetical protein IT582_09850, partial [Opitutaceae bacterium]|nr:hypothetical protein [Opitutaceae bacterium]